MKGCHSDPTAKGWFVPGPGGLVAHDEASLMRIYLKDVPEPLSTVDGKPFQTAGVVVWAAP